MEHTNHHDHVIQAGKVEDGEEGYWSIDLRLILDDKEVRELSAHLDQMGYHVHAEDLLEALDG